MSAGLIEITGNIVVHHPVAVPTASNIFSITELLRQPGSAPTRTELDAFDMEEAE
jgi:hypothetical protein